MPSLRSCKYLLFRQVRSLKRRREITGILKYTPPGSLKTAGPALRQIRK